MEVQKSPSDKCQYAYFELSNQMKCLVVSDPDTDMGAASLDVNVGSVADPKDAPGLAHFLEHMLFMGTEKYPKENYYNEFLSENAGMDNAYTGTEDTNFHFKVAAGKLRETLDIFAQFFIGPLLKEDSVTREMRAVDSENSKNLNNDEWRLLQLVRNSALESHQFNHFGTGNLETLDQPSIYQKLREFHSSYYSSNLMALVVYGKEDTATLETYVRECFDSVPNKNLEAPIDMRCPYDESVLGNLTTVVPIMDTKQLRFLWTLPSLNEHYKIKPQNYLSHLIGHEGKNSLLSMLKAEGLAQELSCGSAGMQYKNFSFMLVNIILTKKGLDNYERVIELVHAYIEMLKQKGAQEWIFEEIKKMAWAQFQNKSKIEPFAYTQKLAWRVHRYPPEKVISGPELYEEFSGSLINSVLEHLVPEKLKVFLLSQSFKDLPMQTEKWYGTLYKTEAFSEELLRKMKSPQANHPNLVLDLPVPNQYIPDSFEVLPPGSSPLPQKIADNERCVIWHKQDDTFQLDKAIIQLMLFCNDAGFNKDPYFYVLGRLWKRLFNDKFREENYLGDQAGIKLKANIEGYGMRVYVNGFSKNLDKFLNKFFEYLANYEVSEEEKELFEDHLAFLQEKYRNHFYSNPTSQIIKKSLDLNLVNGHFSIFEQLDATLRISFEDIKWFSRKWLRNIRTEWFGLGNISAEKLVSMTDSCLDAFVRDRSCSYLSKDNCLSMKTVKIKKTPVETSSSQLVVEKPLIDNTNKNSVSMSLWQICPENIKDLSLLTLIDTILSEPCFDILRTKEQLGYIVACFVRKLRGVINWNVVVQSSGFSPAHLTSRISNFMNTMRSDLKELSQEKFQNFKEAAVIKVAKKDVSMSEQFRRFVVEVDSAAYLFNRKELLEEELKKISKEEVVEAFERYFYTKSRRLDIELVSDNLKESQEQLKAEMSRVVIESDKEFLKVMPTLPQVYIRK